MLIVKHIIFLFLLVTLNFCCRLLLNNPFLKLTIFSCVIFEWTNLFSLQYFTDFYLYWVVFTALHLLLFCWINIEPGPFVYVDKFKNVYQELKHTLIHSDAVSSKQRIFSSLLLPLNFLWGTAEHMVDAQRVFYILLRLTWCYSSLWKIPDYIRFMALTLKEW